jgi:hypothetical protein
MKNVTIMWIPRKKDKIVVTEKPKIKSVNVKVKTMKPKVVKYD